MVFYFLYVSHQILSSSGTRLSDTQQMLSKWGYNVWVDQLVKGSDYHPEGAPSL